MKYFTDIVLFENDEDFSLDMIDAFMKENKITVIGTIKQAMGNEALDELSKACDEAIETSLLPNCYLSLVFHV